MASTADAFAALRNPHVRRLAIARFCGVTGAQIVNVAVGWQLYERTNSAWSLGLVGIAELVPVLLLTIPAGNIADRYPRRTIAIVAQMIFVIASLSLTAISYFHGPVSAIYGVIALIGAARAFSQSASSSLLPQLVSPSEFVNANAWMSSTFQLAAVSGPALGGLIMALTGDATDAYFVAAILEMIFIIAMIPLPTIWPKDSGEKRSVSDLFAGFSFIRKSPVFLAAITLDMFAVLFGAAVVLLPIYAKDILQVGPSGLGWLRAAPSVGSMVMALVMTRLKPWKRPGQVLLWTVVGFGVSTVGFGVSRNFGLSLFFLFLTGAFDSVSVVIRVTIEQMITPDALRGRVSSINYVFVGFSNEFGAFWNGMTASLFGPIAAVIGGGLGSVAVVAAVALFWPALRRIGPLYELRPAEQPALAAQLELHRPAGLCDKGA
ncbi:MAG: MFS transporter [Proteobacteria bacterium]|nr:MFS transporter [Pseudomonadota bacterium]